MVIWRLCESIIVSSMNTAESADYLWLTASADFYVRDSMGRGEVDPRPPYTCSLLTPCLYSVQCTVNSVQCTVYSVQCTVKSVQCTVYSVQCAVYNVQCTVYSVHSSSWDKTVFNTHLGTFDLRSEMFSRSETSLSVAFMVATTL